MFNFTQGKLGSSGKTKVAKIGRGEIGVPVDEL